MKTRIVIDNKGDEYQLTENEEKVVRALERLEKLDFGRIELFGSGKLGLRINGGWYENEFSRLNIPCDGGDGGD